MSSQDAWKIKGRAPDNKNKKRKVKVKVKEVTEDEKIK